MAALLEGVLIIVGAIIGSTAAIIFFVVDARNEILGYLDAHLEEDEDETL